MISTSNGNMGFPNAIAVGCYHKLLSAVVYFQISTNKIRHFVYSPESFPYRIHLIIIKHPHIGSCIKLVHIIGLHTLDTVYGERCQPCRIVTPCIATVFRAIHHPFARHTQTIHSLSACYPYFIGVVGTNRNITYGPIVNQVGNVLVHICPALPSIGTFP